MRLEVGERLGCKMLVEPLPPIRRVDHLQAFGDGARRGVAAQLKDLTAGKKKIHGPPQLGPKFNLAGDGAFLQLAGQTGIQHEAVRELDWLAHDLKVA
jgi:hypothetical protein